MILSSLQGNEASLALAKPPVAGSSVPPSASAAAQATAVGKTYYFSPALVIDPKSGTDVLEYRNSSTGAVTNQYPSEQDIKAYSQHSIKPDVSQAGSDAAPVETASLPASGAAAAATVPLQAAPDTAKPELVSTGIVV